MHNQLNLPVKWYVGSYAELQRIATIHLRKEVAESAKQWTAIEVLCRIFNYDIQAIMDSFLICALESLGVDVAAIEPDPGADRTEHLDQAKQAIATLTAQADALADDRLHDPVHQIYIASSGRLGQCFARLHDFLASIANTADILAAGNLSNPNLEELADVSETRVLASSMSRLLKAQQKVANVADAVAHGNFDADFTGHAETDVVATAIERMVTNIRNLVAEMNKMAAAHRQGEIDATIPSNSFEGMYRTVAQGLNEMVAEHIAIKQKALGCVAEFAKGNFEAKLERFPGKRVFLNNIIEEIRTNLQNLITDINSLAQAAASRNLRARADANRHPGDYKKIIEDINRTLEAAVEPLRATAENANTLASSAEELTATSRTMADGADATATQANAVSAASQEVANNVNNMAASSEEMLASIREIARSAHEAARIARNAVVVATSTNQTIHQLGDSSLQIGKVVKVITSIAQQTNLLALNATIEAARAGEAGKGFAVVANEVKELAKETAKATEEISQKIEAIQSDTKGAVSAIAEVSSIIGQINDISNTIASAVEEQTATTNEIGRNVQEAAKGASEITRTILSVAQSAKETARGALETQKAAQSLTELSSNMQRFVRNFDF